MNKWLVCIRVQYRSPLNRKCSTHTQPFTFDPLRVDNSFSFTNYRDGRIEQFLVMEQKKYCRPE